MITGPRGRAFISYRWSGSDFHRVVSWLALELVRRGYEVILDQWYAEISKQDPAITMMRELAASNLFVAAISPDYLSALHGIVEKNEFGSPHMHHTRNDGWVRDELNLVLMNQHSLFGIGLCFGCRPFPPAPCFPFPTYAITGSNEATIEALDECFGCTLDLPERVRPEIKHKGKWLYLPEVPLSRAYLLVREKLAALSKDPDAYYTPVHNLPYWSRIDRGHIIWERRATMPAAPDAPISQTNLCCNNCTAQYFSWSMDETCPRCRRGKLERRMSGKVEALVILRPADT
ncbi:MAG: TIR domain-containing protein [Deltaproteobacteria bacterium]|nr:TIR domain-containing protein [Deltaproteobacteria bacterium]